MITSRHTKAIIGINPVMLIEGSIPPGRSGLAIEWALNHQQELQENWEKAQSNRPWQRSRLWSNEMLAEITKVKALDPYRLQVRFQDGAEGVIDLAGQVEFTGVFEPLREPDYFRQVYIDDGALTWPNGADLDPDVLYSQGTGAPLPGHELVGPRSIR